jgi:hypothetical protein
MDISQPPRVFISYSHDSPDHEIRVSRLAGRLREDGIDTEIDQYQNAPAEGWPSWMERQIREADFVLIVCTETYLRRVEYREEPNKGLGVLWEAKIIYNHMYADPIGNKFVPVLFDHASSKDIPLLLKGQARYHIDESTDYVALYRHLTSQPALVKPVLGKLKRLPDKEKSEYSLPAALSLEKLSKTMSNPNYAEDIFKLDKIYDRHSVINNETVIVVVGTSVVSELLDRPVAELIRDAVDQGGEGNPFRRGIVLTDQAWYAEDKILAKNPVIAVGGPGANRLAAEFDKWTAPMGLQEGKYTISEEGTLTGFFRKNQAGLPQVGLWGHTANATREAVEHYLRNEKGLREFLRMCWK